MDIEEEMKSCFLEVFKHEWLVFVVQFENSLTLQRYTKENCAKKSFENRLL